MDSDDENDAIAFMACSLIRDALLLDIRTRKERTMHDRAAAMARFLAYEKDDFRRRYFIHLR
jgi:hypothetical protein